MMSLFYSRSTSQQYVLQSDQVMQFKQHLSLYWYVGTSLTHVPSSLLISLLHLSICHSVYRSLLPVSVTFRFRFHTHPLTSFHNKDTTQAEIEPYHHLAPPLKRALPPSIKVGVENTRC